MSSPPPSAGQEGNATPGGPVQPAEPVMSAGRFLRSSFTARSLVSSLLSSIGAVAVALLLGGVVIALSGDDPIEAYRALFRGAFGDLGGVSETLVAAAPLILAGLGFAIAFRAGLFNIGLEGQLLLGSLAAGLIATQNLGPSFIALPIALIAAAAVGGAWAAIAGLMKA